MDKAKLLTPEVCLSDEIKYLVRINKEELVFVDNKDVAILTIDSLAAAEVKRLQNETTKVFKRELEDGLKIQISTQQLGRLYNGPLVKEVEIDAVSVSLAFLTKSRTPAVEYQKC